MTKIKVALLVEDRSITLWALSAIEEVHDLIEISAIYSCQNSHAKRNLRTHFLYYCLNMITIRNAQTRKCPCEIGDAPIREFKAEPAGGSWQKLPQGIIQDIRDKQIKAVLKFGMGLLRITPEMHDIAILSFHHGDAEKYRGRPAGFYELLNREPKQGVIVQRLSNELDGGEVLGRGFFKITHHSYRKTLEHIYANSRYVLRRAFLAYREGRSIPQASRGKLYSLPRNIDVALFAAVLGWRKLVRIGYGLFFEKIWSLKRIRNTSFWQLGQNYPQSVTIKSAKPYQFYADSFFSADGKRIYAEALSSRTGRGEIIRMEADGRKRMVLLAGPHYSYPYPFEIDGREYLLPECCSHSAPFLLDVETGDRTGLMGLEDVGLIDASLLHFDGQYFLFAGNRGGELDRLHLYVADAPEGPYTNHPESPVILDPQNARMGGRFVRDGDHLYRLGQNNCFKYGQSLWVMRVEELTSIRYRESPVFEIRNKGTYGPHTLDGFEENWILDSYYDRFSFMAGPRRIYWRLKARFG